MSSSISRCSVWLRDLISLQFVTDLSDNEYTIGRAQDCNITISYLEVKEDVLHTISKRHCKIVRVTPEVYLEDYSSNGTYVNSEKVGKGNRRILKNNDQISLAWPHFKGT
jgi:serine/threonine-protein kinase Chk2